MAEGRQAEVTFPALKENRDIHDKFCQGENGDFPQPSELHRWPCFTPSCRPIFLIFPSGPQIMRPDIHLPHIGFITGSFSGHRFRCPENEPTTLLQKIELGPNPPALKHCPGRATESVHAVPNSARPGGENRFAMKDYVRSVMPLSSRSQSQFPAGQQPA
jgi:hypothetical protein